MQLRKTIAAVIGAATVLLTAGLANPAFAAYDLVQIQNWNSLKCAAIPGGNPANYVQAIQFDCGGTGNADRYWERELQYIDGFHHPVYIFRNHLTKKCLEAAGANGGPARQNTCSATSDNQLWAYDSGERLHNVGTNRCLAVPAAQLGDGVKLIQWTCGTGDEQRWYLQDF
jgi:hypothetical protein